MKFIEVRLAENIIELNPNNQIKCDDKLSYELKYLRAIKKYHNWPILYSKEFLQSLEGTLKSQTLKLNPKP